jgi:rod shape-determining protein MreC
MQNLILFIRRFYTSFIFLLFLVVSILILVNYNYYQKSSLLNSSNRLVGSVYQSVEKVNGYLTLGKENEMLMQENSRLRNLLMESYYTDTFSVKHLNDSIFRQHYNYVEARIISNSISKKENYLTINKGSLHGITPKQGVICKDGVVGVVVSVSPRFSVVMSVLHVRSSITPKVENDNYFGSVKWDGFSPKTVQLTEVNMFANVKPGQMVYTSGFSYHFPEGIPIGRITKADLKEGNNFYDIDLELTTDFTSVRNVYVIRNLFKAQLDSLEKTVIDRK